MDAWEGLRRQRRMSTARKCVEFVDECVVAGTVSASRLGRTQAAVAFLAPLSSGPIPTEIVAVVQQAVERTAPRDEAPVNVAVAVGAGWGRVIDPGRRCQWQGVWDHALSALADDFARSLHFSVAMLSRLVPTVQLDATEIRSLADMFAMEFALGCRCGRHRRVCDDPSGHRCCVSQHRLDCWDPSVAHLSAYIDQAVRGLAGNTIKGAAFADGMLYGELKRAGRVRRAFVEAFECPMCAHRADRPTCGSPGCPGPQPGIRWRRIALPNRLVSSVDVGGDHRPERRYLCGAIDCDEIYPIFDGPDCPRCHWSPATGHPATRQVWVRANQRGPGRVR